jgi:hypothetical protein
MDRIGCPISSEYASVPVALVVESACHGECRISVMFVEAALSEKSPYLGSPWVRLDLRYNSRMQPDEVSR